MKLLLRAWILRLKTESSYQVNVRSFPSGQYKLFNSSCHVNPDVSMLHVNWLSVLIMSHTCFRVNPHSIVAWMSRNSLLETGAISEVVTGTGLEPTT